MHFLNAKRSRRLRALLRLPVDLASRAFNKNNAKLYHKGILLDDFVEKKDQGRVVFFYRLTTDALRFLEAHDGLRFRRVQREANLINLVLLHQKRNTTGFYSPLTRDIAVNFIGFDAAEAGGADGADYEWYVACCASVLVHEATHGALFTRYVPYANATRVRVERLCCREEERFVARLPSTRYDYAADFSSPFDPSRWDELWNQTVWERLAFTVAVLRDIGGGRKPLSQGSLSAALSVFRTDETRQTEGGAATTNFRVDRAPPPLFSRLSGGALGPNVAPRRGADAPFPSFFLQADAPLSKDAPPHPLAFSFADTLAATNRAALQKSGFEFGGNRSAVAAPAETGDEAGDLPKTAKGAGLG